MYIHISPKAYDPIPKLYLTILLGDYKIISQTAPYANGSMNCIRLKIKHKCKKFPANAGNRRGASVGVRRTPHISPGTLSQPGSAP